jgi:catechol 2,3-dioxygenase-like lactoylglutathione lyase family enzyme
MTDWFARPVLHVTDVEASIRFYVERLGFTPGWRHEAEGRPLVAQVDRDGCALILASTWADKAGAGTMFISLNTEPASSKAQAVALDALRAEFTGRGAPVSEGYWGYRVIMVADPDGNTLMFNYAN